MLKFKYCVGVTMAVAAGALLLIAIDGAAQQPAKKKVVAAKVPTPVAPAANKPAVIVIQDQGGNQHQNGQAGQQGEQQNGQVGEQGEKQNGQQGEQGEKQNGQHGDQGGNQGNARGNQLPPAAAQFRPNNPGAAGAAPARPKIQAPVRNGAK